MNPVRIMAYPYTAWIAPQFTKFPSLTESEATIEGATYVIEGGPASGSTTSWFKLGTSGNRDYSEAGVTVTHSQTIATFQGAGSTWVRKAWRSDEGMQVAFDLADVSPKQYAQIMDEATLNQTTEGLTGNSTASGEEWFTLSRGLNVKGQALFLRGISSLVEESTYAKDGGISGTATAKQGRSQYEVPFCYQGGTPAPKYAIKGGPALLSLQFIAVEGEASTTANPLAGLPRLRVQK